MSKFNYSLILLQFCTYFLSTRSQLLTGNCQEAIRTYMELLLEMYPGIVLPPFLLRYDGLPRMIGCPLGNDPCNIPQNNLSPSNMGSQKRTSILLPRLLPGGVTIDTPKRDATIGAAYTNAEYSGLNSGQAFKSTHDQLGQALKKEQVASHQSETNRFQTINSYTEHAQTNKQRLHESSMDQMMNHGGTLKAGSGFGGTSARLIQPGLASSFQQGGLYSDYNREIALKQMLANGGTKSSALKRPYGDYNRDNMEGLNEIHHGYGLGVNGMYAQNQNLAEASSGGSMLVNHASSQAEIAYLQQRKLQEERIQHQLQNKLQQEAIQRYQQNGANHVFAENQKLAPAYSGGTQFANQAGMGHLQQMPMQQEAFRHQQQNEANHAYAEHQKVAESHHSTTNHISTQAIMGQTQQEKIREEILHQQQGKLQHESIQSHHQNGQNDGPLGFYLLGGEVKGDNYHAGGNGMQTAAFGSSSVQQQSYASGQMHHAGGVGVQGLEVIPPGGVREVVKGGQKVLISNTECPDKSELCITIDS
ncbi:uncharacterized protein LOC123320032 isoform X2 [Coccinella septempunctata]|uniref:uncharacterized protein LOC123320032 isoform X2 n=1 Tax=Coccinella septempunctata TaxID=41139 RepID=UPI001D090E27|nr:uncharacterized protein LOC123320032 isoform X2 [Coccinella septempunctata]